MVMNIEDSTAIYNADIDFIYKEMSKNIHSSSSFKTDSNGVAVLEFTISGGVGFNENIRLAVIKEGYKTQKRYYNTDTLLDCYSNNCLLKLNDLPSRYIDMATIYRYECNYYGFYLIPPIYL